MRPKTQNLISYITKINPKNLKNFKFAKFGFFVTFIFTFPIPPKRKKLLYKYMSILIKIPCVFPVRIHWIHLKIPIISWCLTFAKLFGHIFKGAEIGNFCAKRIWQVYSYKK